MTSDHLPFNPANLPTLHAGGEERVLACLAPPEGRVCALPPFEMSLEARDYREVDLRDGIDLPRRNQGRTGSCGGQSSATAFDLAFRLSGQKRPASLFSAYGLYAACNGGKDGGVSLMDVLETLKDRGCPLEEDVPNGALFLPQIPTPAWEKAKRFRVAEAWELKSFADICTALTLRFPVVAGIVVGNNFGTLDSTGTSPLPDVEAGGHALAMVGLRKHPQHGWQARCQNSWGRAWGADGDSWLTEAHFRRLLGAFALLCPFDDAGDGETDPPVARA